MKLRCRLLVGVGLLALFPTLTLADQPRWDRPREGHYDYPRNAPRHHPRWEHPRSDHPRHDHPRYDHPRHDGPRSGWGRPWHSLNGYNRPRGSLSEMISSGRRNGDLSRDELEAIRDEQRELREKEWKYRRDGYLSAAERRDLAEEYRELREEVREEIRDDERGGRRGWSW